MLVGGCASNGQRGTINFLKLVINIESMYGEYVGGCEGGGAHRQGPQVNQIGTRGDIKRMELMDVTQAAQIAGGDIFTILKLGGNYARQWWPCCLDC
jgi:hypothetical protein